MVCIFLMLFNSSKDCSQYLPNLLQQYRSFVNTWAPNLIPNTPASNHLARLLSLRSEIPDGIRCKIRILFGNRSYKLKTQYISRQHINHRAPSDLAFSISPPLYIRASKVIVLFADLAHIRSQKRGSNKLSTRLNVALGHCCIQHGTYTKDQFREFVKRPARCSKKRSPLLSRWCINSNTRRPH